MLAGLCAERRLRLRRRLRRQYDLAEPLYSEALQLLARAPCGADLACAWRLCQQLNGSPACSQETTLGVSHPSVGATLHNLAGLYVQKGDFAAARQAYANALAKKEASLGRHHPEYAATLAQLAEVVRVQGRLDDAAALLRQAADVLDAVGAGHTRIAIARLGRLAAVLAEGGKLNDAVAVHRRLLQSAENAPDPKPSAVVQAQTGLADALCRIGRHDDAIDLYRQSLAILQGLGTAAGNDAAAAVVRRRLAEAELAAHGTDAAALDGAERLLVDAVAALRVAVEQDAARVAGAGASAPGKASGVSPSKAAASAKRAEDAAAANRLELAFALTALAVLHARRGRADAAADASRAAHEALQHVSSGVARDALAAKLLRLRR